MPPHAPQKISIKDDSQSYTGCKSLLIFKNTEKHIEVLFLAGASSKILFEDEQDEVGAAKEASAMQMGNVWRNKAN